MSRSDLCISIHDMTGFSFICRIYLACNMDCNCSCTDNHKKCLVLMLCFQTLYLKNLSPRVTEEDLMSLFLHFQTSNTAPVVIRLLHGRMRGQAFVTFDCTYSGFIVRVSVHLKLHLCFHLFL